MSDTTTIEISHEDATLIGCVLQNASKEAKKLRKERPESPEALAAMYAQLMELWGFADAQATRIFHALPAHIQQAIRDDNEVPKP